MNLKVFQLNPLMDMNKQDVMSVMIMFVNLQIFQQDLLAVSYTHLTLPTIYSTGSVGAPDGWSTVLTRTGAGVDVFSAAVDAGLIETKPMDDVKPGLGLLEKLAKGKKDKGKKEIERRAKMGVMTPTYY